MATPAASPEKKPLPPGAIDEKLFSGMQWRQIGPFRGGRALAIEGVPGEPDTWYFGGVAGAVWKTIDGGQNWTPLFDKEDISSIGAIAVAPSDHNVIYVGTGEAAIRGNTTYGAGVYKSHETIPRVRARAQYVSEQYRTNRALSGCLEKVEQHSLLRFNSRPQTAYSARRRTWVDASAFVMRKCYALAIPSTLCEGSGGGEIRTHEAFRPSGFQDRRIQPLCHPSVRK